MSKVIRLTESDLEMIIKKVIKEQTGPGLTSFTPGYSDYRFNTKEMNPVGLAQRALIKKGYSVGSKGADGVMGPNTKNAILKYQKDNGLKQTGIIGPITAKSLGVQPLTQTKPPMLKSKLSGTEPTQGDGFFTSMVKKVKNAVSEIEDFFALPLHIRAFMKFTGLNKKPFTLNDLTKDEQSAIKQMLSYAEKKGMIKNGKIVNFYDIANALNNETEKIDFKDKKSLGFGQGNIKSQYTRVAMTLGNAVVSKSGSNYIIKDTYDFNNFINNPEKYTLAETPKTVANALKNIGTGNYVQGVEELASYYQKLGYSGYPVDIAV